MYGFTEPNSLLKEAVVSSINKKRSQSSRKPSLKSVRSRKLHVTYDDTYLDQEIKRLQKVERSLKRSLRIRKTMSASESEFARRREDLNHRLQKEKEDIKEAIKERDQARKDKKNVESAYVDVQEKYERVLKSLIAHKEKEEMLIERDNQHMQEIKDIDEKLEQFKITAQQQVESEYQSWLSKLAEAEATNLRLKALIRKADMKVEKLEHELGQKNKENQELHDLCDELINNTSRRSSRQD